MPLNNPLMDQYNDFKAQVPSPTAPMPVESSLPQPPAPPASAGPPGPGQAPSLNDFVHQHLMALPVNTSEGKRRYKREFIQGFIQNAASNWASLYGQQLARQAPQTPMQQAQTRYQTALAAGQEQQNEQDPAKTPMTPYQAATVQHWNRQDAQGSTPPTPAPVEPPEPPDWQKMEDDHQDRVDKRMKMVMQSPEAQLAGMQGEKSGWTGKYQGDVKEGTAPGLRNQQAFLEKKRAEISLQLRRQGLEHGPEGQLLPGFDRQNPQTLRAMAATIQSDPRVKRYLEELAAMKEKEAGPR